jgi:glycerol-3-phosphate cytidylyltransferase
MTIIDRLIEIYGKEKIDDFLYKIDNCDLNFKLFKQHISLSEDYEPSVSFFKSYIIQKLNEKYNGDRYFLYDMVNMLSKFDFTFKKYNTCITYGTFDLFHIGHLNLIRRIKAMCSDLVVAVSTDEFNTLKGKKCVIPYAERSAIVSSIKYVDKVIPETDWEQKLSDVEKYNVDCFVMGDDWTGKFDFLKEKCDVVYLPRTEGISTTQIKEILR